MIDAIDEINTNSPLQYTPVVSQPPTNNSDAVVLSETAQAKLLQQEGLNIAEIADQLGITTSTVLSELGITPTNSQTATASAI
jgi:ABC-type Fe2+-enterobactin transport system substrate-binding protein